jgi:hypothetical protein
MTERRNPELVEFRESLRGAGHPSGTIDFYASYASGSPSGCTCRCARPAGGSLKRRSAASSPTTATPERRGSIPRPSREDPARTAE